MNEKLDKVRNLLLDIKVNSLYSEFKHQLILRYHIILILKRDEEL